MILVCSNWICKNAYLNQLKTHQIANFLETEFELSGNRCKKVGFNPRQGDSNSGPSDQGTGMVPVGCCIGFDQIRDADNLKCAQVLLKTRHLQTENEQSLAATLDEDSERTGGPTA
jgi:hypothetical protein